MKPSAEAKKRLDQNVGRVGRAVAHDKIVFGWTSLAGSSSLALSSDGRVRPSAAVARFTALPLLT